MTASNLQKQFTFQKKVIECKKKEKRKGKLDFRKQQASCSNIERERGEEQAGVEKNNV